MNAGKDNLPCISTAMLQPVSANNSSLPLGQPPLPGQNSTPLAGSTERNRSRSSPSSSDPSWSMVEQCMQTSTHPADFSSGNLSTGQVASDQPDTGEPCWPSMVLYVCAVYVHIEAGVRLSHS